MKQIAFSQQELSSLVLAEAKSRQGLPTDGARVVFVTNPEIGLVAVIELQEPEPQTVHPASAPTQHT